MSWIDWVIAGLSLHLLVGFLVVGARGSILYAANSLAKNGAADSLRISLKILLNAFGILCLLSLLWPIVLIATFRLKQGKLEQAPGGSQKRSQNRDKE